MTRSRTISAIAVAVVAVLWAAPWSCFAGCVIVGLLCRFFGCVSLSFERYFSLFGLS